MRKNALRIGGLKTIFQQYESQTHSKTLLNFFTLSVASDPFRGLHGAPIIEPFDSTTTIEVNADKTIECKASRPVTWISEV